MLQYSRFLVPFLVLCLTVAFVLPLAHVGFAPGFSGFLVIVGLGAGFSLLFRLYRMIETWFVNKVGGSKVVRETTAQLFGGVIAVANALLLFGVSQIFPTVVLLDSVANAFLAGLALTAAGLSVAPSTALTCWSATATPVPTPSPVVPPEGKKEVDASPRVELDSDELRAQAADQARLKLDAPDQGPTEQ